ncbi:hypothetical protein JCM10908_000319 [Rhodotorula pacifica]|uniref:ribonuclease III domain-containing protein n=1 Tax=Rhodotorula pacifica TaxID=1495444 RepID=UPI003174A0DC
MSRESGPQRPPPLEWHEPFLTFRLANLPPLPTICDPSAAAAATRHRTALARQSNGVATPREREEAELGANNRLEWAGDALLHWLVSAELLDRFPSATQGDLSILRQRIVSNRTLSHLAWQYGLGQHLQAHRGLSQGRLVVTHQKLLADAIEAHVAAAAQPLSSFESYQAVRTFVRQLLSPECAVGLEEAAADLRSRRLAGVPRTLELAPVPAAARVSSPLTTSQSPGSHCEPADADSGDPALRCVVLGRGGSCLVSIQVGNREVASGRESKKPRAFERACVDLLERLSKHPPVLALLLNDSVPAPPAVEPH